MDNKIHIDDLLRQKLDGHEMPYNPAHWEAVKTSLSGPRAADSFLRMGFWKLFMTGIGTVVITGFTVVLLMVTHGGGTSRGNQQKISQASGIASQSTLSFRDAIAETKPEYNASTNPSYRPQQKAPKTSVATATAGSGQNYDITAEQPAVKQQQGSEIPVQDESQPVAANDNPVEQPLAEVVTGDDPRGMSEEERLGYLYPDSASDMSIYGDYEASGKETNRSWFLNLILGTGKFGLARKLYPETPPDHKIALRNDITVNPAFTGFKQRHTVNIFTASEKPFARLNDGMKLPVSAGLAYDFSFGRGRKFAIGFWAVDQNAAYENNIYTGLAFAYKMNIGKYNKLRAGVSLDYNMTSISGSAITLPQMIDNIHGFVFNQNDPAIENNGSKITGNSSINAGMWFSRKNFYAGMAVNHLAQLRSSNEAYQGTVRPAELSLSAGQGFKVSESVQLMPSIRYEQIKNRSYFTPSLYCSYNRHWFAGIESPNMNSAGLVLGMYFFDSFMFHLTSSVSWNKEIVKEFGGIDYLRAGVRFQFGEFRKL